MTEELLLDLSMIIDRPKILLRTKTHPAGQIYELLHPSELSAFQLAIIQKLNPAVILDPAKRPTKKQEAAQRKALLELVQMVGPSIPAAIRSAAPTMYLLAFYMAFLGLIKDGDQGNARSARTSTTGASSRGSKSSTAATPRRGSTTRNGS